MKISPSVVLVIMIVLQNMCMCEALALVSRYLSKTNSSHVT